MATLREYIIFFWIDILNLLISVWHVGTNILWRLNGVAAQLERIHTGREEVQSAQVLRIVYKHPYTIDLRPNTMCIVHESFAPASIVLRPNVHLHSIGYEYVTFMELDMAIDPLNLRKNPILILAHRISAKRIIKLTRSDFDEIVAQLDSEDDREVVWVFHTIRCGSTVWAQIFNTLPNWTVFSEPAAMWRSICDGYTDTDINSFSKSKEYEEVVVGFIKMFLRLAPKGNAVLWKTHGILTDQMVPVIRKRFPKHKIMFSYRDVLSSTQSFHKLTIALPVMQTRIPLMYSGMTNRNTVGEKRTAKLYWASSSSNIHFLKAAEEVKLMPSAFEWYVFLWATRISVFRNYQKNGIDIKCLYYDHLIKDPKSYISTVFDYLGISQELVDKAAKSIGCDSQAGLAFSQKKQATISSQREDGQVMRCNEVLKMYGLPDLDSEFIMFNSFSSDHKYK